MTERMVWMDRGRMTTTRRTGANGQRADDDGTDGRTDGRTDDDEGDDGT
jgi:hypothetical protein